MILEILIPMFDATSSCKLPKLNQGFDGFGIRSLPEEEVHELHE